MTEFNILIKRIPKALLFKTKLEEIRSEVLTLRDGSIVDPFISFFSLSKPNPKDT
jgi:hypothetical protein